MARDLSFTLPLSRGSKDRPFTFNLFTRHEEIIHWLNDGLSGQTAANSLRGDPSGAHPSRAMIPHLQSSVALVTAMQADPYSTTG
jgi:hypothetical protein